MTRTHTERIKNHRSHPTRSDLEEEVSEGRCGERRGGERQRGRGVGGGGRRRSLGGRSRGDERGGHGGNGESLHPETGHLRLLGG